MHFTIAKGVLLGFLGLAWVAWIILLGGGAAVTDELNKRIRDADVSNQAEDVRSRAIPLPLSAWRRTAIPLCSGPCLLLVLNVSEMTTAAADILRM